MKQTEQNKKKDKNEFPRNLYVRGDSWILDFYYRGQRYTENLGPVSRTVAKEVRDRRKGAVAAGKLDIGPKIQDLLFEQACERYLAYYKANQRARSYERHVTSSIVLKTFFNGKRLSQISTLLVEKYKLDRKTACACAAGPKREEKSDRCEECKHFVKARADATINRELTMLKHMFNLCMKWKFAKVNPVRDVKFYKENNARVRYLTEDEARIFLQACSKDFRAVALAAMHTGFRKSELKSLRWTNVDFDNGSITVESGYSKNGETGTVPLSADLAKALSALRAERKPAPDDLVFMIGGNPWKSWRTAFEKAVARAGLKDFRFHDLRHCFGSWLAMNNVNDKARMELMRHKDPKMTMRYSHLSVDYKRQAVEKLPTFGAEILKVESQQISQRTAEAKVVAFAK